MLRNECFVQGLAKVSSFKTHRCLTGIDESGDKVLLQTFNRLPISSLTGI